MPADTFSAIAAFVIVSALFAWLGWWEVKRYKAAIDKERKQTELYQTLLDKLNEE